MKLAHILIDAKASLCLGVADAETSIAKGCWWLRTGTKITSSLAAEVFWNKWNSDNQSRVVYSSNVTRLYLFEPE